MVQAKQKGFSLIEMLLVLVVVASLLTMAISFVTQRADDLRRDRASLQVQQILNASLAYYVNNSSWPVDIKTLTDANYLPKGKPLSNPWGQLFKLSSDTSTGVFYVATNVKRSADAAIVAGRLPFGFITNAAGSRLVPPTGGKCATAVTADCTYVVSSVSIPGQNLNNARSVNFASIYNSGACVPAPTCPLKMKPQIFVVPVSVAGVVDQPDCSSGTCQYKSHSLSAFTARAIGNNGHPYKGSDSIPLCNGTGSQLCVAGDPPGKIIKDSDYWRVCLMVMTEKGLVSPPGSDNKWGAAMGRLLAVTRCVPDNEPTGSGIGVYVP